MHRIDANQIHFELFEAAPRNAVVNKTTAETPTGRLIRTFPGEAIVCPWDLVLDEPFRHEFCEFVSKLHEENVHDFQNSVDTIVLPGHPPKADPLDSEHPGMVTDLLANILAPRGKVLPGGALTKRTREECFYAGAGHPWRRTPFWIVIRVAIAHTLSHIFQPEDSRTQYKISCCTCYLSLPSESKIRGSHWSGNTFCLSSLRAELLNLDLMHWGSS